MYHLCSTLHVCQCGGALHTKSAAAQIDSSLNLIAMRIWKVAGGIDDGVP